MRLALDQAQNALLVGEVPVGAVIVRDTPTGRQVVATGYNRPDHRAATRPRTPRSSRCAMPRSCSATTGCPIASST